jgi:enoyl-CoA hydratase
MEYKCLTLEKDAGVGIVSLNNPPANTISFELVKELKAVAAELDKDDKIRCVLIRSSLERFFCAGADLSDIPAETLNLLLAPPKDSDPVEVLKKFIADVSVRIADVFADFHEALSMIERMRKPSIAVINGHALGGGLELAMSCDFRYMGQNSGKVGLPEVNLGLIPLGGGTQRLPRLIGKSKALDLLINGAKLQSDEALSIGLINRVFPADTLEEEALSEAKKLARSATLSIGIIKSCVNEGLDKDIEEGLRIERDSFKELVKAEDLIEGVMSFIEHREPQFKGR